MRNNTLKNNTLKLFALLMAGFTLAPNELNRGSADLTNKWIISIDSSKSLVSAECINHKVLVFSSENRSELEARFKNTIGGPEVDSYGFTDRNTETVFIVLSDAIAPIAQISVAPTQEDSQFPDRYLARRLNHLLMTSQTLNLETFQNRLAQFENLYDPYGANAAQGDTRIFEFVTSYSSLDELKASIAAELRA
jgi:hypothetical protein